MRDTFNNEQELLDYMNTMPIAPLRIFARGMGVTPRNHPRQELIDKVVAIFKGERLPDKPSRIGRPVASASSKMPIPTQKERDKADRSVNSAYPRIGVVDLSNGQGVVRVSAFDDCPASYPLDPVLVESFSLDTGDEVRVLLCNIDNGVQVSDIVEINGQAPDAFTRVPFERLTACHPTQRIELGGEQTDYALRVLDLVAPLGRGQRGLIVAPPRTGKTTLIKKIAMAVQKNAPDIYLSVVLIDQTPEEITEFQESLDCKVSHTAFDGEAADHIKLAETVIANARRRVEQGQHVMLLVDGITNLVDAYQQIGQANAISRVRALFGNARCVKQAGSLTILATVISRSGNAMDEQICQSLGRIANMVVYLDRRISQKRIFPAIDINQSGTDKEDLLFTESQAEGVYNIRRMLSCEDVVVATEELLEIVTSTTSNDEAIETLKRLAANAETRRNAK